MKVSELFDYTNAYRLLEDEGGGYTGVTDAGAATGSGAGETTSEPGTATIPAHDHDHVFFAPRLFGPNGLLYMLAYAQMLANRRDFRIGQAIRKSKRKFTPPPALNNKYFKDGFKNPTKIQKFDY